MFQDLRIGGLFRFGRSNERRAKVNRVFIRVIIERFIEGINIYIGSVPFARD